MLEYVSVWTFGFWGVGCGGVSEREIYYLSKVFLLQVQPFYARYLLKNIPPTPH